MQIIYTSEQEEGLNDGGIYGKPVFSVNFYHKEMTISTKNAILAYIWSLQIDYAAVEIANNTIIAYILSLQIDYAAVKMKGLSLMLGYSLRSVSSNN